MVIYVLFKETGFHAFVFCYYKKIIFTIVNYCVCAWVRVYVCVFTFYLFIYLQQDRKTYHSGYSEGTKHTLNSLFFFLLSIYIGPIFIFLISTNVRPL
jgi:hypothetical protein